MVLVGAGRVAEALQLLERPGCGVDELVGLGLQTLGPRGVEASLRPVSGCGVIELVLEGRAAPGPVSGVVAVVVSLRRSVTWRWGSELFGVVWGVGCGGKRKVVAMGFRCWCPDVVGLCIGQEGRGTQHAVEGRGGPERPTTCCVVQPGRLRRLRVCVPQCNERVVPERPAKRGAGSA